MVEVPNICNRAGYSHDLTQGQEPESSYWWLIGGSYQQFVGTQHFYPSILSLITIPGQEGKIAYNDLLYKWIQMYFKFPIVGHLGSLHFKKNLCIYFWLDQVSLTVCGLSLVVMSGGYSLWCQASHFDGFSCCGAKALGSGALVVAAHGFSSFGSWALERGLSSCDAWAQLLPGMWNLSKDPARGPCVGRWTVIHCTTREALFYTFCDTSSVTVNILTVISCYYLHMRFL